MEKKHALVLSGGGAYGAFEVGVAKALAAGRCASTGYRPLEPAIYTGTSVGAFNAVFLASLWQYPLVHAVDHLEQVWLERIADQRDGNGNGVYRWRLSPFAVLDPRIFFRHPLRTLGRLIEDSASLSLGGIRRTYWFFTEQQEPIPDRLAGLFDLSAFISTEPLRQTLHETIDFECVRRSTKVLKIAATNWTTGKLELAGGEDMTAERGLEVTLGSASIPGIFPAEPYGQDMLVDGGVLMNTPLRPAIFAGADVLHAVELMPKSTGVPLRTIASTIGAMNRAQNTSWDFIVNAEVERIEMLNRMNEAFSRVRQYVESTDLKPRVRNLVQETLTKTRTYVQAAVNLKHLPKPVTIHRYHPTGDFQQGPLGMLLFDRRSIERYIEMGFREACQHDCARNGCVLPESATGTNLPEPEPFELEFRRAAARADRRAESRNNA